MKKCIVIPARMKSSRLPGKPLIDLMGKSMIQRTVEQCQKVMDNDQIFVATDDQQIFDHCRSFNFNVIMTSNECLTGTDRVYEVSQKIEADYYINVQGDEPLINPDDIKLTIESIEKYSGAIINGYTEINEEELWKSSSIPKVAFRNDGRLLYMSRAPIPTSKNFEFEKAWRQVCIYAYTRDALLHFSNCKNKTTFEQIEDIEILRFLELGFEVQMIKMSNESIAIDTTDDIGKVLNKLMHNVK